MGWIRAASASLSGNKFHTLCPENLLSEAEFYTPPPLEAKIATDTLNPFPAPVVYKISGPKGEGFVYTTGAEADNSAVRFAKESVPPLYKIQSPILRLFLGDNLQSCDPGRHLQECSEASAF